MKIRLLLLAFLTTTAAYSITVEYLPSDLTIQEFRNLKQAILNNNTFTIQEFVNRKNIGTNTPLFEGKTILMLAAEVNNISVLKSALADPEVDVNLQDSLGNTALHYAAVLHYRECIDALLALPQTRMTLPNKAGKVALYDLMGMIQRSGDKILCIQPLLVTDFFKR